MITDKQIHDLSRHFSIDGTTVLREYLQLMLLNSLYLQKGAGDILFKGGTALRLFFQSPRFSEDLDFSTTHGPVRIKTIVRAVEDDLRHELPDMHIFLTYTGKNGLRFRLRHSSTNLPYPLVILLDFQFGTMPKGEISSLTTVFPFVVFPLICHYSQKEILTEKYQALLERRKGRDLFDMWHLVKQGISIQPKDKVAIRDSISTFPQKQLEQDVARFLPKSQRIILQHLKQSLLDALTTPGLNNYEK